MSNIVEKIKNLPEPARKKFFVAAMAVIFLTVFSLYVFSIRSSIISAAAEESEGKGLVGEFSLPSVKDSVGAALSDIFKK